MTKKSIYRISFYNQDTIYEIYARKICESDLFGFIEVEELVFSKHSGVVIDPSEERLKVEFSGVKRSFIPVHAIIRMDEVNKEGASKITETKAAGNVSAFPRSIYTKRDD